MRKKVSLCKHTFFSLTFSSSLIFLHCETFIILSKDEDGEEEKEERLGERKKPKEREREKGKEKKRRDGCTFRFPNIK